MKVFVTGGNGFLGSRTVHELVRNGYAVRCLLRSTSRTDRIAGLPYETHRGDILDLPSLVAGMAGCDAVIHLACASAWSQIRALGTGLDTVAVEGTRNVLEAARQTRVKRIVHVSSSAAINASHRPAIYNEQSPYELGQTTLRYSQAKNRAEQVVQTYIREHGLDATIVNPCEAYGAGDTDLVTASNLIEILKGTPAVVCQGGTSVAHVDDIARGVVLALKKGRTGERYILGGENLSIAQLARAARRAAGRSTWVITVANWILQPLCRTLARLGISPPVPLDVLDYAVLYWFVDSTKAQRELGYTSRPTQETFQDVIGWLRSTHRIA